MTSPTTVQQLWRQLANRPRLLGIAAKVCCDGISPFYCEKPCDWCLSEAVIVLRQEIKDIRHARQHG